MNGQALTEQCPPARFWPHERDVVARFGRIELGDDGRPRERWERSALTSISLPFPMRLCYDPTRTVRRLTCHRAVARDLVQILAEILAHYGDAAAVQAAGMDLFAGCYRFGTNALGDRLSMHSYGIAIDLSPDVTEDVVAIFERHGWTWGGRFDRLHESNHFQAAQRG